MHEIKRIEIKDYGTAEFINETGDTRNGFKHYSELYINGCYRGSNTAYYLNRTWECYRYQTVMMGLVRMLIDENKELEKERFKEAHGYGRMTATRTAEFEAEFKDNAFDKIYNEILEALK